MDEDPVLTFMNCTPFIRQYDILSNKWGAVQFRGAVFSAQQAFRLPDTGILDPSQAKQIAVNSGSVENRIKCERIIVFM